MDYKNKYLKYKKKYLELQNQYGNGSGFCDISHKNNIGTCWLIAILMIFIDEDAYK
jgi:hypothetical protein